MLQKLYDSFVRLSLHWNCVWCANMCAYHWDFAANFKVIHVDIFKNILLNKKKTQNNIRYGNINELRMSVGIWEKKMLFFCCCCYSSNRSFEKLHRMHHHRWLYQSTVQQSNKIELFVEIKCAMIHNSSYEA